jgi:peptidylprolyl isomerase
MSAIIRGNKVKVHYTGKFEDGEIFDTSVGRDPLEFLAGMGQVVPGFDAAVMGMSVGEKRSIALAPQEAYGMPRPELIAKVEKSQFPEDIELEIGMGFEVPAEEDGKIAVVVTKIEEDMITLDGNYPLAGKTLHFDIEVVEFE